MFNKFKLALNFSLARRTLGEKICLSCLKFNLSRAPGQVIFFTPDKRFTLFLSNPGFCDVISNCIASSVFAHLFVCLCFTSHQQRGHLETAPPFTVPCEGLEAR